MSKVESKKVSRKSPSPSPKRKVVKEKKEKKEKVVKEKKEKVVKEKKEKVVKEKVDEKQTSPFDVVSEKFDELVKTIAGEISEIKNEKKTVGVKFLKSLNKELNSLKKLTLKVSKQKKKVVRKSNNNSGFLKPVSVSKEIIEFTGWDSDGKYSRVDVTKFICNYIKENDLQNPEDRRQINPDKKLQSLLGYNPKKDEPLRYYSIQKYLKSHFSTE